MIDTSVESAATADESERLGDGRKRCPGIFKKVRGGRSVCFFFLLLTLLFLAGCSKNFSQMRMDAEMHGLCEKDGGIRVYETVRLPPEDFNKYGQIDFYHPTQHENALGPEYIWKEEMKTLYSEGEGLTGDDLLYALQLVRCHGQLYGYGFAGNQSTVSSAVGKDIGFIAQYDLNQGDVLAATAAEAAQQQAYGIATSTPTAGTGSAILEGAKWDQQVITWSLADSSGTNAASFSGYMDSSYEPSVKDAFNAWAAAAPGTTFEEVSDSSQSDIRIGFNSFDTATSGVVGYTNYKATNGQMLPDTIIRLEDPSQDPLVTGADGQQTYAGTGPTLAQTLQHEIGHALGFADNADSSSIMYYELTSSNRSLDSTDLAGMSSLYDAGMNVSAANSSSMNQLIQAMATFNAGTGAADTSLMPSATLLANTITLAPSVHVN